MKCWRKGERLLNMWDGVGEHIASYNQKEVGLLCHQLPLDTLSLALECWSCLTYFVTGGGAGSANANFAHFDNFPKSSSADFGAFNASQINTTASAASKAAVNKPNLQSADKYAALANLDNIFSAGQGIKVYFLRCLFHLCILTTRMAVLVKIITIFQNVLSLSYQ